MSFTYQKLSVGTDGQSHHMTSVTYHSLHPLPVAGEYNLLPAGLYTPWGGGGGGGGGTMGVVLDNRGHNDKIRGYSIPLKLYSENTANIECWLH